ncbi:MAG: shikimate kinase [Candidatus Nanohaloarchaea archaeon]
MKGKASAPGALTVINAISTLKGSAFAIDLRTTAEVELDPGRDEVRGEIEGKPDEDTEMIERCVELVLDRFDVDAGGEVRTSGEIPMASGLKSSSAAANAAVLATLEAIDEEMDRREATLIGVQASRDAGVTVTGALDDASSSMLGGVVVTDNSEDEVLHHEEFERYCAVYIPDESVRSVDTDVDRSKTISPVIEEVFEIAMDGRYARAMTINGLAYCAALDFDTGPVIEALEHCEGASLSGTGPSYGAIGTEEEVESVLDEWEDLPGETMKLRTDNTGGRKE